MACSEKTSQSWSACLQDAWKSVVFGLLCILGGSTLFWWNEGETAEKQTALDEVRRETVELTDLSRVDAAHDGTLVHAVGMADSQAVLRDPLFGVSGTGLRLFRQVWYYQWRERAETVRQKNAEGREESVITYSYYRDWVREPVNSNRFHDPNARLEHRNRVHLPLKPFSQSAPHIMLGAYELPDQLVRLITEAEPLPVSLDDGVRSSLIRDCLRTDPDPLRWLDGHFLKRLVSDVDTLTDDELPAIVHVHDNAVLIGRSPRRPEIGDIRIRFTLVRPRTVSILARVTGNTFAPYRCRNGSEICTLQTGDVTKEILLVREEQHADLAAWTFRVLGLILVAGGIHLVFSPLVPLLGGVPVLGTVLAAGAGSVAVFLGLAWSCACVAIAWVRFRPEAAMWLSGAAALLLMAVYMKGRIGSGSGPKRSRAKRGGNL